MYKRIIRNAVCADAPVIAKTEQTIAATPGLLCSQPAEISEDKIRSTIAQFAQQHSSGIYLVVECQGLVVGHAFVERHPLAHLRHTADLTIAIHPDWQGQGIGKELLTELIAQAKAKGIEKIKLNVRASNTAAIALYKKLGFQIEGRLKKHLRLKDRYIDDLVMGLLLTSDMATNTPQA